jgi:hypothetical protein
MKFKSITQDPVVIDGDKYSVVLENERVRVPGTTISLGTGLYNTLTLTTYCTRSLLLSDV